MTARQLLNGLLRRPATEPRPPRDDAALAELSAALERASRKRLGRSLSIREIDAGSCNGCELELHALNNAIYDLERFGIRFVASPRHADVLVVTGPVTRNMKEALEFTASATPDPKWVVAVGDCARDGGIFAGSYAVVGGVSEVLPVDLHIGGCPPRPIEILRGLLALLEQADAREQAPPVPEGPNTASVTARQGRSPAG
jgi:Ni,Fe-hydrogenase III small subunit